MKKCSYTDQRERIVAEAISPVASELRLLDAADLISLLRFELNGNLSDLVSSAAELYFHPGTVVFGAGGEYRLEWGGPPEIILDIEIKPRDITIYAQLVLTDAHAAIDIKHIAFHKSAGDPDANTRMLTERLQEARFVKGQATPIYG
ncbi:hypothetical protein ACSV9I_04960 [Rhizobium sp. G187]|uniref:hypothetical protein n=1 Tax=unclassified Rhizobium TaxID=2613769 RepID=UPI0006B8C6D1|nr:hypothetical protein [Rhizobium sp. AAP43]KPF42068.1 hypothetical protein IP76_18355 [Rhizobium sp. AAP43]